MLGSGGYTFDRFAARRVYYSFDFLPKSNDIIYSVNTSGQFNIWRQPSSGRGTGPLPARQLTAFQEWSVRNITATPDGRKILAFADKDGDENYQIFEVDSQKGWHRPLVLEPQVRHEYGIQAVSNDGRFIAHGSNRRNPRDMDVMITSLTTGRTRPLLAGGASYVFGRWARDGRRATVVDMKSPQDLDVYVVDIKTGKRKMMTRHSGNEVNMPGPWEAGGTGFYLLSDRDREFTGLCFVPTETGKREWLVSGRSDVEDVALSPDGRTLAWAENREGYSIIHIVDARTKKELRDPILTGGAITPGALDNFTLLKFSPEGNKLACIISMAWQPPEIYMFDVPSMVRSRLTYGFVGNVPQQEMVRPRLIAYQSFDRKIPAFLYKPRVAAKRRVPVLLMIHGGPQAQERPWYGYAGMYQYLLSQGIGVLAPNIRGSSGFGKSYTKLILHDWGGDELKDIEHAWKYLLKLSWVDPRRIAIAGGSFGGFAALSAVTRIPQAWRAAVDIFGPSNLVTFAKAVPPHWKRMMAEWLGDPDKERKFLLERSPMTYVKNVRSPMLIIQGANDPRVVKKESDQFVEKLKSLGREVDYMVLPDEGHGFTKQKNEFAAYKRITDFLVNQLHL